MVVRTASPALSYLYGPLLPAMVPLFTFFFFGLFWIGYNAMAKIYLFILHYGFYSK